MQTNQNSFITERLPLAIFLHASKVLRFSHCEEAAQDKVKFIFDDPSKRGDQLELEFESGAVVAANRLFASQKYLRRKMTETPNSNNRKNEHDYLGR